MRGSFLGEALSRDLKFAIDATEGGKGSCIDRLPSIIAAASEYGPGITCHATYFGGRELDPAWKLVDVIVSGRFDWLEEPRLGTPVPRFPIALSAVTRQSLQLRLVKIVLQGPSCDDCKTAFSAAEQ